MSIREIPMNTKKTVRQNSGQQITNILTQGVVTPQNVKIEVEEPTPSFLEDISDIMRGLGDCERPLRDSVQLMEKIVQRQVRGILADAIELSAKRRGSGSPTLADFEFLMRRSPTKVYRMRKHLQTLRRIRRESMSSLQAIVKETEGKASDSDEEVDDLETVDEYDEEKMRRVFRADRLSMIFSGQSYKEYVKCRETSFYSRDRDRMRLRIRKFLSIPDDIQLSSMCFNILAYLIHETIATVVDFAILTRLNTENRSTDPYSRMTATGTTYDMPQCPEVTQGRGGEGVRPITVTEINEALRRHTMCSRRNVGFQRLIETKMCYLAL